MASIWDGFDRYMENMKQQGLWYRSIQTDHMMLTVEAQQQLAEYLLELV